MYTQHTHTHTHIHIYYVYVCPFIYSLWPCETFVTFRRDAAMRSWTGSPGPRTPRRLPRCRTHCPHMYPPARTCVSSSHTSSCPYTRHTCANYNNILYICTVPIGIYNNIVYIIMRVGIHPVRANHPLLAGWRTASFGAHSRCVRMEISRRFCNYPKGDRCGSLWDLLLGAAART